MARPATKLSLIFKGEKAITAETALQLEKVVGVPAHIWLGLDSEYRLTLARQQEQEEEERLKMKSGWFPILLHELVKVGIVQARPDLKTRFLKCKRFLRGIPPCRPEVRRFQAAFRKEMSRGTVQIAGTLHGGVARIGVIKAQGISCGPFDNRHLSAG
jgi:HTH-type transcriptional regulator/antitoxin HigA